MWQELFSYEAVSPPPQLLFDRWKAVWDTYPESLFFTPSVLLHNAAYFWQMLTSACCSDRSQAGGLAGLQTLQLNQTPRSECKHFNRVMRCISTIPVCTKALSGLLLVKHTHHHCKDYPQELDVTFAPLGLFICITVWGFILQTVVFLEGYNRLQFPPNFNKSYETNASDVPKHPRFRASVTVLFFWERRV